MSPKFKQGVKVILQSIGILKFVIYCCGFSFKNFFLSMRSYLFNGLLTFIPNHRMRVFYLKNIMGIRIGTSCFIHMGVKFGEGVSIGNNSVIGRNCVLWGDITIKNNVSITAETYIFTATHSLDSSTFAAFNKPVIIEDYAWIGARAMILPGVRVGEGAVLGAASTATKSIPNYSIFAGSPAKMVGERPKSLEYTLVYFPFFQ